MAKKAIIIFFFIFPFVASATYCIDISGAGTSGINGTYEDTGLTAQSNPVFGLQEEYAYYLYRRSDAWGIGTDYTCQDGCSDLGYYNLDTGYPPPSSSWVTNSGGGEPGSEPPPSLSSVYECVEGGGGSIGVGTPTTTVVYADWIYVNTWIIFLLAFLGAGTVFSLFKSQK